MVCFSLLAVLSPVSGRADEIAGLERFDFRQVVREAKGKVFPAVVFIKVLREDMQRGEKLSQEVSGSGVIISAAGEILSNWHVVDKATEVRCLLFDGRAYTAKVLGAASGAGFSTIAVIRPWRSLKSSVATMP